MSIAIDSFCAASSLRNSSRSATRKLPSRLPLAASSLCRRACASRLRGASSSSTWRRISIARSGFFSRSSASCARSSATVTASVAVGVRLPPLQDVVEQRPVAARARQPRQPLERFLVGRPPLDDLFPGPRRAHRVAELAVDDAGVALPRLDALGPRRHLRQRPLHRRRRLGPLFDRRFQPRRAPRSAFRSFLSSLTARSSRSAAAAASPRFS